MKEIRQLLHDLNKHIKQLPEHYKMSPEVFHLLTMSTPLSGIESALDMIEKLEKKKK